MACLLAAVVCVLALSARPHNYNASLTYDVANNDFADVLQYEHRFGVNQCRNNIVTSPFICTRGPPGGGEGSISDPLSDVQ